MLGPIDVSCAFMQVSKVNVVISIMASREKVEEFIYLTRQLVRIRWHFFLHTNFASNNQTKVFLQNKQQWDNEAIDCRDSLDKSLRQPEKQRYCNISFFCRLEADAIFDLTETFSLFGGWRLFFLENCITVCLSKQERIWPVRRQEFVDIVTLGPQRGSD